MGRDMVWPPCAPSLPRLWRRRGAESTIYGDFADRADSAGRAVLDRSVEIGVAIREPHDAIGAASARSIARSAHVSWPAVIP